MPRGLVAMARSGGHCPPRVSGGILCSERGISRNAFQAIRLEETSVRCNNVLYPWLFGGFLNNSINFSFSSALICTILLFGRSYIIGNFSRRVFSGQSSVGLQQF